MKGIGWAALTGLAALMLTAAPSQATVRPHENSLQPSCPAAPAVANAYLRAQAGKKLTMTRGEIISAITKETGADGSFAGLTPCQSGYPNAVRFWIDEVLKAGTNNSP